MKTKTFNWLSCRNALFLFFVPFYLSYEYKSGCCGIVELFYPMHFTGNHFNNFTIVCAVLMWLFLVSIIISYIFLYNKKLCNRTWAKVTAYSINFMVPLLFMIFGIIAAPIANDSAITFAFLPFALQLILYVIFFIKHKSDNDDKNVEEVNNNENLIETGKLKGKAWGVSLSLLLWYLGLIVAYCNGDTKCRQSAKKTFVISTVVFGYLLLSLAIVLPILL